MVNQLIYSSVDDANNEAYLTVKANVAYSYEIVRLAGRQAQKMPQFSSDTKVQAYKFSDPFVRTWLKNMQLRRRRIKFPLRLWTQLVIGNLRDDHMPQRIPRLRSLRKGQKSQEEDTAK
jgi:hypothetical protein